MRRWRDLDLQFFSLLASIGLAAHWAREGWAHYWFMRRWAADHDQR